MLEEISIEKYFKDGSTPSTVITDNFLLYYMERYMEKFKDEIGNIFLESEEHTFDEIAEMMKEYPLEIVRDALLRIVSNNYLFRGDMVLREDQSTFFLSKDSSLPFRTIRYPRVGTTSEDVEESQDGDSIDESQSPLEYVRSLSVSRKAALLGEILVSKDIGGFKEPCTHSAHNTPFAQIASTACPIEYTWMDLIFWRVVIKSSWGP